MNKEQALKCIDLSKSHFNSGEAGIVQALKFAHKAVKLEPGLSEAVDWLRYLTGEKERKSSTKHTSPPPPRARKRSKSPGKVGRGTGKPYSSDKTASSSTTQQRPWTAQQVDGIERIKKSKGDLYAVLGLQKDCSDADIKKAYRKLALQYHPDKCSAPGADEAFKAIGSSFAILSDPSKRSNYDRFGLQSENASGGGFSPFAGSAAHTHFDGAIDPEELFNMFFGGGGGMDGINMHTFAFGSGVRPRFANSRARFQHQRRHEAHPPPPPPQPVGWAQFIQALPMLLFLLFSVFSMFSGSHDSSPFILDGPNGVYSEQRYTARRRTPYWVNPKTFTRNYGSNVFGLEKQVETQYLKVLQYQCGQERQHQNFLYQRARGWFGVDQIKLEKARSYPMPHCQALRDWSAS